MMRIKLNLSVTKDAHGNMYHIVLAKRKLLIVAENFRINARLKYATVLRKVKTLVFHTIFSFRTVNIELYFRLHVADTRKMSFELSHGIR